MVKNNSKKFLIILLIIFIVGVLFIVSLVMIGKNSERKEHAGFANIAVIKIYGPIQPDASQSPFSAQSATPDAIIKLIEKAKKDPKIKGFLIEINSPGGTVLASKEIGTAVKLLGKPNVALIKDVGASGGYWIASSADYVVADSLSITGSIGVISSSLSFEGFLNDHNVTYERLVAGKYKDAGSPYRDLTPEEFAILQSKLDLIHDAFIKEVAMNRNLTETKVREIATGMFYLGSEAYDLGLVDELGGRSEAEAYLKSELNATSINFIEYKNPRSLFGLFSEVISNGFFNVGLGLSKGISTQNSYEMRV